MKRASFIPIVVALAALWAACQREEVYFRFHQIEKGLWERGSAAVFVLDSLSVDPAKRYAASIEVTTGNAYPYRELRLFVEHNLGDSAMHHDTLDIQLSDAHGKWIGSGTGGLHQLSVPYMSGVQIDPAETYLLRIGQGMRDVSLKGVERIGLRLAEVPAAK